MDNKASNIFVMYFLTTFLITGAVSMFIYVIYDLISIPDDTPKPIVETTLETTLKPIIEGMEDCPTFLSRKGHILTKKQMQNRSKQLSFDISFYNRIIAVYNMKLLSNACENILKNPSEKLDLSLEQIQRVRSDYTYANTKINKYIMKSRNHPQIHILFALAH